MSLLVQAGSESRPPVGEPATSLETAILVPCHNEEATIAAVVRAFRRVLPEATVYVYDNDSTDRTADAARAEGARVRRESVRGKGNVVRRMFADVEADVYVLVDGDDTYDADSARRLIDLLVSDELDMVCGTRHHEDGDAYRTGHQFGNRMLTRLTSWIFGGAVEDMLTGYRVFSRRFVKSFPALSTGFEIETELTIHALELRLPTGAVDTAYAARPNGSVSKLRTYSDGLRILNTIVTLVREERPLFFFGLIAALLCGCSLGLAWPIVVEFAETGLVPRLPTAVLATGMMLLGFLSLFSGLILDTVTRGRREAKRMWYLSLASVRPKKEETGPPH